jgi:hypothetical protein
MDISDVEGVLLRRLPAGLDGRMALESPRCDIYDGTEDCRTAVLQAQALLCSELASHLPADEAAEAPVGVRG